jgi:hypothetical protein
MKFTPAVSDDSPINDRALGPVVAASRGKPEVKVLVACQDFETCTRTRRLVDGIVGQFDGSHSVQRVVWTFDMLGSAALCNLAALEAAEAQIVIVAAREAGELPADVNQWIERWATVRPMMWGALMAFLIPADEPETSAGNLRSQLRRVAARRGMDFWCYSDGWQEAKATKVEGVALRPSYSWPAVLCA